MCVFVCQISPQFHRNIATETPNQRKCQSRRLPLADQAGGKSSNNSSSVLMSRTLPTHRRSKFRPLRFASDDTVLRESRPVARAISKRHSPLGRLDAVTETAMPASSPVIEAAVTECDTTRARLTESQAERCGQLEIDTPDMDWDDLNPADISCHTAGVQICQRRLSVVELDSGVVSREIRCVTLKTFPVCEKVPNPVLADYGGVLNQDSSCHQESDDNSAKVRDLLSSILAMTPPPSYNIDSAVLANDTPVSDYELTYRQRALRNGRVRMRSVTEVS